MSIPEHHRLLSVKELASALGRHRNYIGQMRTRGFAMPSSRATLAEARAWLARNPSPRSEKKFESAAA